MRAREGMGGLSTQASQRRGWLSVGNMGEDTSSSWQLP